MAISCPGENADPLRIEWAHLYELGRRVDELALRLKVIDALPVVRGAPGDSDNYYEVGPEDEPREYPGWKPLSSIIGAPWAISPDDAEVELIQRFDVTVQPGANIHPRDPDCSFTVVRRRYLANADGSYYRFPVRHTMERMAHDTVTCANIPDQAPQQNLFFLAEADGCLCKTLFKVVKDTETGLYTLASATEASDFPEAPEHGCCQTLEIPRIGDPLCYNQNIIPAAYVIRKQKWKAAMAVLPEGAEIEAPWLPARDEDGEITYAADGSMSFGETRFIPKIPAPEDIPSCEGGPTTDIQFLSSVDEEGNASLMWAQRKFRGRFVWPIRRRWMNQLVYAITTLCACGTSGGPASKAILKNDPSADTNIRFDPATFFTENPQPPGDVGIYWPWPFEDAAGMAYAAAAGFDAGWSTTREDGDAAGPYTIGSVLFSDLAWSELKVWGGDDDEDKPGCLTKITPASYRLLFQTGCSDASGNGVREDAGYLNVREQFPWDDVCCGEEPCAGGNGLNIYCRTIAVLQRIIRSLEEGAILPNLQYSKPSLYEIVEADLLADFEYANSDAGQTGWGYAIGFGINFPANPSSLFYEGNVGCICSPAACTLPASESLKSAGYDGTLSFPLGSACAAVSINTAPRSSVLNLCNSVIDGGGAPTTMFVLGQATAGTWLGPTPPYINLRVCLNGDCVEDANFLILAAGDLSPLSSISLTATCVDVTDEFSVVTPCSDYTGHANAVVYCRFGYSAYTPQTYSPYTYEPYEEPP